MCSKGSQWERAFGMIKPKRRTEAKLHSMVTNYLLLQYPYARFSSSLTGESQDNRSVRHRNALIQHSPGQPDLSIFWNNGQYTGLALEIKAVDKNPYKKNGDLKAGEHLQNQLGWLDYLRSQGWKAEFAVGFEEAKKLIDIYFTPIR